MLYSFANEEDLLPALVDSISATLAAAIAAKGSAMLAVSGGRTPVPLFEALSRQEIDWPSVVVVLVDERWLPLDHPDSNAGLVHKHLLRKRAEAARFVGLTNGADTPFEAEQAINQRLSELSWPLDITLLGMGYDGHTASLFPQAGTLTRALEGFDSSGQRQSRCCAIEPPAASHLRMTLTAPVLAQADRIVLHIKGAEKKQVLEAAIAGEDIEAMPIRYFLHGARNKLDIYYSEY